MRAYFFGNMYLSSIQQGIQAGHVIHELFLGYPQTQIEKMSEEEKMLWDWANDHKTVCLLNGGYSENIRALCELFCSHRNPYPWANFCEGIDALDGALTCVGIVLPEKIYVAAKLLRDGAISSWNLETVVHNPDNVEEEWTFTSWEVKLIFELNKYRMAH